MAQFGKATSKRGKPTYTCAIIGVSLVLFLFGIVGWFFLNLRKTGDYLKENIQVHAWLNPNASKKKIDSLTKLYHFHSIRQPGGICNQGNGCAKMEYRK